MGFNKRKMEDQRRQAAEKEAAGRRATDAQVLEDAERLITAWNERQAKRMPMLFSPTIGAAVTAGYWFLWVRCPACRTTNAIDLRTLDRHHDAAVTSLIPALSCRSCRPNAPFAELTLAPELPAGHGDGRRLTRVLINLVGNTIKFTDAGEVAIKAEANNGSFLCLGTRHRTRHLRSRSGQAVSGVSAGGQCHHQEERRHGIRACDL
jgi:hypothetical protein